MAIAVELNITADVFEVVVNALSNQAEKIKEALEKLGTSVGGVTYSKTAYFPNGIYYLDDPIFIRTAGGAHAWNVTLRGDGPGSTILKIFFSERAGLAAFDTLNWTVASNVLRINTTNTIANIDSAMWTVTVPTSSRLYFRRRLPTAGWKSGMKFQVFENGNSTPLHEETAADDDYETFSVPVSTSAGAKSFYFRLVDAAGGVDSDNAVEINRVAVAKDTSGNTEHTIFSITGSGTDANPGIVSHFKIKDMTLDGGAIYDEKGQLFVGRKIIWFNFNKVSLIEMEHLHIINTNGSGIRAKCWWDSCLYDVHFASVGRVFDAQAAIDLSSLSIDTDQLGRDTCCNNLKLIACRWEGSQYISCLLHEFQRQIYFIGGKWHGKLIPVNGGNGPVPVNFPQVDILENCAGISVAEGRFTNWGSTHLRATEARNVLVTGSVIDAADGYGIQLIGCNGCAITGNGFPAGAESENVLGDVYASGGFGNFIDSNGMTPAGRLILKDEFATGTTSSGSIGDLGWTLGNDGTASTTVAITGAFSDHPGVIKLTCSSATGISGMLLGAVQGRMIRPENLFDLTFVLKFEDTGSTVGYSFGLTTQGAGQFDPTDGMYFRKEKNQVNWFGCCSSGSSKTTTTNVVAAADITSWHTFRIRRNTATQILFSIDGGLDQPVESNIPTVGLNPFFVFDNVTPQKDVLIDLSHLNRLREDQF